MTRAARPRYFLISHPERIVRGLIFCYTWRHAVFFSIWLFTRLIKERRVFAGTSLRYRYKVFLLCLRTHLGNDHFYWNPLFTFIMRREPRSPYSKEDDSAWDLIIPHGYAALQQIRRFIPSHAYPFFTCADRIPDLLSKEERY